jgi:hypothetical protein
MDLTGLIEGSRIAPAVLGHRGSKMVVDVSSCMQVAVDERSNLPFCPVEGVFEADAVFLGFGTPNVFLMVPRGTSEGWDKFAAFMFYRQASYVAEKMDRMQVGIYFELRGLPEEARASLRHQMEKQKGHRTPSCANANARVLAAAGFTCGGKSLKRVYRPSKLAALIWENGLEYNGTRVEIRPIQAGREVADHFVGVWLKEFTSACRTIKKKWAGHHPTTGSAPQFDAPERIGMSAERWEASEQFAAVGISRPSWLGVWMGFMLGQRPIFTMDLDTPLEAPALQTTLKAFPGKLDRITKLKRYVLFSKPVVWFVRRQLMRDVDRYNDVPRRAVVEMLHRSESCESENAFVYNLVVTKQQIQLTRLENRNGRDHKVINWLMAKHVLTSGYNPDVVFAGEVWCCKEDDIYVIYLSANSGTYKPNDERLKAIATLFEELFDTPVRMVFAR